MANLSLLPELMQNPGNGPIAGAWAIPVRCYTTFQIIDFIAGLVPGFFEGIGDLFLKFLAENGHVFLFEHPGSNHRQHI